MFGVAPAVSNIPFSSFCNMRVRKAFNMLSLTVNQHKLVRTLAVMHGQSIVQFSITASDIWIYAMMSHLQRRANPHRSPGPH